MTREFIGTRLLKADLDFGPGIRRPLIADQRLKSTPTHKGNPRAWTFFFDGGFVGVIKFPPHSAAVLSDLHLQRIECGVQRPEISDFDRSHALILTYKNAELIASCRAEFQEHSPVEISGIYEEIVGRENISDYFYCSRLSVKKSVASNGVINYLFYLLEFIGRSEGKSAVVANCLYRIRRFYESKGFRIEDSWKFQHPVLHNESIVMIKPQDDLFFRAIGKGAWMEESEE